MEFPKFVGNNPTEWFNRVGQFFEFQEAPEDQKVQLAIYHLDGKANQWCQWLRKAYWEEGQNITWETFEKELWARFKHLEGVDFDEALSKLQQVSSDYQKEFKRLENQVQG